ncbi:hypothetical protein FRC11_014776 [Ceratobasidium sp. 423]|nr:hypothetical protein FRC11_014776 [Ceratobasidium sp. 423]
MKTTADIEHELEQLRRFLLRLPPKDSPPGFTYPFEGFIIYEEYVELTGSIQGSVNHSLEVAFGSRANADGSPIRFKSHGPDLVAVVDVLADTITGTHGENPILLKWIVDLQAAVNHAFDNPDPPAVSMDNYMRQFGAWKMDYN